MHEEESSGLIIQSIDTASKTVPAAEEESSISETIDEVIKREKIITPTSYVIYSGMRFDLRSCLALFEKIEEPFVVLGVDPVYVSVDSETSEKRWSLTPEELSERLERNISSSEHAFKVVPVNLPDEESGEKFRSFEVSDGDKLIGKVVLTPQVGVDEGFNFTPQVPKAWAGKQLSGILMIGNEMADDSDFANAVATLPDHSLIVSDHQMPEVVPCSSIGIDKLSSEG